LTKIAPKSGSSKDYAVTKRYELYQSLQTLTHHFRPCARHPRHKTRVKSTTWIDRAGPPERRG